MNLFKTLPSYVVCIICIYIFAFNPVFLPFGEMGLVKLLYPLLLFCIGVEYRKELQNFKKIYILYFAAIFVTIFGGLISSSNIFYTRCVNLIEIFFIPIILAKSFHKHSIKLPMVVFCVAVLASGISLLAYLNPYVLLYLRSVQPVANSVNDYTLSVREFGFSSELYSGYGWALGFITAYMLLKIKDYSYFLIALPIIFFAILINSRSGAIAVLIGFSFYALLNRKVSSFLSVISIAFLFIYFVNHVDLGWINEGTMTFITDFFDQLSNIFKGDHDNTYIGVYTGYQFVLPDTFSEWIIGRGFSLMGNNYGVASSDVGYLNDLAIGGIIYIALVYTSYYRLFKLINVKWFYVASIVIFLILNIKGNVLETNCLSRLFALIVFYEALQIRTNEDY